MLHSLSKIVSIGATRSGKSYMLKFFQQSYDRVFVIDGNYEYNVQGAIYCTGYNEFLKLVVSLEAMDKFFFIFRFADHELNEREIVENICRILFNLGDLMLVIEEAHDYAGTHNQDSYFRKIATKGSHKGIGYMLSTQRPSLINKTLLTQCDYILVFNLTDPNDILYVKSFIGEKAKLVSSLPPRHFIMYHRPSSGPVTVTQETSEGLIIQK